MTMPVIGSSGGLRYTRSCRDTLPGQSISHWPVSLLNGVRMVRTYYDITGSHDHSGIGRVTSCATSVPGGFTHAAALCRITVRLVLHSSLLAPDHAMTAVGVSHEDPVLNEVSALPRVLYGA